MLTDQIVRLQIFRSAGRRLVADLTWWGIVLTMVIELGMITPPIGMNVFVIHGIAPDIPLGAVFRGIAPFVVADLVRVGLVVVFPGLALWLPAMLK